MGAHLLQEFVEAQAIQKVLEEAKAVELAAVAARRATRHASASKLQRSWVKRKGGTSLWLTALRRLVATQEAEIAASADMNTHLLPAGEARSDGATPRDVHNLSWEWGPPEPGSWRMALQQLVTSVWLDRASMVLVLLNVGLMCMPYYGMSATYEAKLERWSSAITWMFILEMAAKLGGFGCTAYWEDRWNRLDGSIVIMSMVEMGLSALFEASGVKLSFLRVLRILRVVRVLRLMRSWRGLHKIVFTIHRALPQLSNVMILLVVICSIFALLGMEAFGGKFSRELGYVGYGSGSEAGLNISLARQLEPLPRFHFDYFIPAALSIFILMTGDAWSSAMLDGISVAGPGASAFHITVTLLGTYLIMNLPVAILLDLFADNDDSTDEVDSHSYKVSNVENSQRSDGAETDAACSASDDLAFGVLRPDDPFRMRCRELIESQRVDQLLISAVFASSLTLIIDNPRLDRDSPAGVALYLLDLSFVGVFAFEAGAKSIAYGFAFTQSAYLRSGWNILDFCLLVVSTGALLSELLPQLTFLRPLRALRVLRPLRLLSRNKGMALVLSSLWESMPAVSNVVGVLLALQIVFAIVGMQLFAGSFAACTDPMVMDPRDCTGFAVASPPSLLSDIRQLRRLKGGSEGDNSPFIGERVWRNPISGSFDDFAQAMILLFVISTGDGMCLS